MNQTYDNHVILGAGGAITQSLVPELLRAKQNVILASRKGTQLDGTRGVIADLADYPSLAKAVPEGSAVYLLAGLPYDLRVWKELWPRVMDNAIRVCREKQALLVFFDNVYAYGLVEGAMTEETPHNPVSKKGEIRARIADRLIDEYSSGRLRAIIARSADFYGPGGERNGVPNVLIVDRLLAGKSPQWMVEVDKPHSLTYTKDCGKALPLLAADKSAYNQIWHLPTASPAISMRRFMELAAGFLKKQAKPAVLSRSMLTLAGLFDRTVRELPEMLYQNTENYLFDSSKFDKHFDFSPTSYERGIEATVEYHRQLRGRAARPVPPGS
jgi:nucleoside-diphosphate-sugar epimerase